MHQSASMSSMNCWRLSRTELNMSDIVSVTIEEICHRFLILFEGSEAVSEASGHLTGLRLTLGQVTTLGQDVGFVGVVSHAPSMGHHGAQWGKWWTLAQLVGRLTWVYLTLCSVIYIELCLMFGHVDIIQDDTVVYSPDAISCC